MVICEHTIVAKYLCGVIHDNASNWWKCADNILILKHLCELWRCNDLWHIMYRITQDISDSDSISDGK